MTSDLREFAHRCCEERPGAELTFPFDTVTAVYKVGGKMFALLPQNTPVGSVSLKCDPEDGVALRSQHPAIGPGYHLNKRHWITVDFAAGIDRDLLAELIAESHRLVVDGLPVKQRARYR